MERKIIVTGDKSKTLLIPALDETYHSTHGALNEARHVFIKNGLSNIKDDQVAIFELGFGTGLNLLVTLEAIQQTSQHIHYTGIEKYPLSYELVQEMHYEKLFSKDLIPAFKKAHQADWENKTRIHPQLMLEKMNADIQTANIGAEVYDLIYFDAFGPRVQPDLWSVTLLKKMYQSLKTPGKLVTYCAQGQFKRNLKTAGFDVKNVPGPPGKREMTIGLKTAESTVSI
jgi:tRNA U34 5-methylaminomethyl-2-thiouridine-forming methyltransferase MnmC